MRPPLGSLGPGRVRIDLGAPAALLLWRLGRRRANQRGVHQRPRLHHQPPHLKLTVDLGKPRPGPANPRTDGRSPNAASSSGSPSPYHAPNSTALNRLSTGYDARPVGAA